jgi:hypothetical protein
MSGYLTETLEAPEIQLAGSFNGRIASSPTDLADKVYVTLDTIDGYRFGPCRWQARDASSLPGPGDRCVVVFTETQEPAVVLWWPYDT